MENSAAPAANGCGRLEVPTVNIVQNASPNSGGGDGAALRNAALARLRVRRATIIRRLSRAAVEIALESGEVHVDAVRDRVPIPPQIRPCVVGAAMRDLVDARLIYRIGHRRTRRPIAHARFASVWRLTSRDAALAWLAAHPPLDA